MKKRIVALALMCIMALSIMPASHAQQQVNVPFTDIANHPHRAAIEFCFRRGYVRGVTPTTFSPNASITREHFAILWSRTLQARLSHRFNDVQQIPDEIDSAIILMHALRHINGVSETHFSRRTPLSREQALAIVYRAYIRGVAGNDAHREFTDYRNISEWAVTAVGAARRMGLLDGVFSGNALQPQRDITRGEVCQIIYNIMRENAPTQHTITINAGITNGTVTSNRASAFAGETVTLTVTPAAGYRLIPSRLRYNDVAIDVHGTTGTFTMPDENVTITAEFELIPAPTQHTITIAAGITNGTVTADRATAAAGETVTLTVTPDAGYSLVAGSLMFNGNVITGNTFTMPDANVTITATFAVT